MIEKGFFICNFCKNKLQKITQNMTLIADSYFCHKCKQTNKITVINGEAYAKKRKG